VTLDAMGQRYGMRPSRFIKGLSEFQALTIDVKAANAGALAEEEARRRARNRGH
jgi:hypothetical protein